MWIFCWTTNQFPTEMLRNEYQGQLLAQSFHDLVCIFMDDFDIGFSNQSLTWFRYIDDIFFIWAHGAESQEKFLSDLIIKLSQFVITVAFCYKKPNAFCNKLLSHFVIVTFANFFPYFINYVIKMKYFLLELKAP